MQRMTMGLATAEAVFYRRGTGGEVRGGEGISVMVRGEEPRELEGAAAQIGEKLRSKGHSPRRVCIRTEEGAVMLTHELPPTPARGAAPEPEPETPAEGAAPPPAPETQDPPGNPAGQAAAEPAPAGPKKEPPMSDEAKAASGNVSPATVVTHHRAISALERQMKSIQGQLRAAQKAAKSDGVNLDALREFRRWSKMDEDDRTILMKQTNLYAQFLGRPLGFQGSMFDTSEPVPEKVKTEANLEIAHEAGFEAGRAGAAGEPDQRPYPVGSVLSDEWWRGYVEGQKLNAPKASGSARKRQGKQGDGGNPEDGAAKTETRRRRAPNTH